MMPFSAPCAAAHSFVAKATPLIAPSAATSPSTIAPIRPASFWLWSIQLTKPPRSVPTQPTSVEITGSSFWPIMIPAASIEAFATSSFWFIVDWMAFQLSTLSPALACAAAMVLTLASYVPRWAPPIVRTVFKPVVPPTIFDIAALNV